MGLRSDMACRPHSPLSAIRFHVYIYSPKSVTEMGATSLRGITVIVTLRLGMLLPRTWIYINSGLYVPFSYLLLTQAFLKGFSAAYDV